MNHKVIPTSKEVFAVIRAAHDLYASQHSDDSYHVEIFHLAQNGGPLLEKRIDLKWGQERLFICYSESRHD